MREFLEAVPGFLPGLAISLVVAVVVSAPVGRVLQTRRLLALALVVSLGAILAATLMPKVGSPEAASAGAFCDLSRLTPAPLDELVSLRGEPSLNFLLCVPLGLAMGLLPRSRPRVALLTGAVLLPVAIELLQGLLTPLNRSCSSADVVDNVTGLAVGLVASSSAGWLWRSRPRVTS